jgi:cytochrome c oxidase cbb3-type subunit 3
MTHENLNGVEEGREENLMAHEYDGIREYDNPLPAWWTWTWIATMVFCIPYVGWYHLGDGPSLTDKYEHELEAFAAQLVETYGDLEATPETIASFMHDPVAMAGMASQFRSKCAQCHLDDGSGQVGPNLTDDAWLHVVELTDIVRVLQDGVPAKGMPAWADQFTDTQTVLMAAYVASLRMEPKAGKAPQGEVIPSWESAGGTR